MKKLSLLIYCSPLLAMSLLGCRIGGNNCFPAGTKIQTPTGETNVEMIQIGDEVLGYNQDTGLIATVHVTQTHVHHHDSELKTLTLQNGTVLEVTPEHPLYSVTRQGWAKAGTLTVGEQLRALDENGTLTVPEIMEITSHGNDADVFNLETDGTKNYFVGGILAKYY